MRNMTHVKAYSFCRSAVNKSFISHEGKKNTTTLITVSKGNSHVFNFCTFYFKNANYCEAARKILLSGDVEIQPGPNGKNPVSLLNVLETKLSHYGLAPLETGSGGNCFFHVISHKLFADPKYHLFVRAAGVRYLRENPERFIESNLDQSWLQYLESMSQQGTWADNLIIQAVADSFNLRIIIVESNPNFADVNIIEPEVPQQHLVTIFIGREPE